MGSESDREGPSDGVGGRGCERAVGLVRERCQVNGQGLVEGWKRQVR